MSKQNFGLLLKKYLDGQCTDAERQMVESWFSLLDEEESVRSLSKEDLQQVEQRLWRRLQQSTSTPVEKTSSPAIVRRMSPLFRVAAVLIFLAVGAATFYLVIQKPGAGEQTIAGTNRIEKVNNGNSPLTVTLDDGSLVELAAHSRLFYQPRFTAERRKVQLEGTAFFQVQKDSLRPFFVHSQQLVTQVLGTSFWVIYDSSKKESSVEVISGKVAVYKSGTGGEAAAEKQLLTPNEKLVLNGEANTFITTLVAAPVPVLRDSASGVRRFVYDEAPLSVVLKDLEEYYAIQIELVDERFQNLRFTGNLASLDYYTKLKAICRSLQLQYQVSGNRILFTKD